MSSHPALRRPALASLVMVGALALTACGGDSGTGSGGGQSNYVQGTGVITSVQRGERQAAPELSGETVDGGTIDVADYRGKVVVLNVWGSWCPPCRAEMPHLVKVAEEMKPQGVQFIGINTRDTQKVPAQRFEKEFEVPYPSLYDPTGKLLLRFPRGSLNPQAIPSTLVLDREGKIAARALKALSEDELNKMIKPIVAEK
ncbi:TlpA family protein disulfide reductase [Streptomyces gobiensis]|uniref:TlpA family protein disulfide reductase n=1 Tax=Streptomyces gobiensis TaxID=2875706 RepID=UPI001E4BE39C|nr:TlpA disulfide reductase family protein [Streptomyces gobiensis]UGY92932.1 TlpA family protein disulfide reductase [Streptomyces gobiensis]